MASCKEVAMRITNQMVKGIEGKEPALPEKTIEEIKQKWSGLADLFEPLVPRTPFKSVSSAIGAAMCKCAIKYGLPKTVAFCEAVNHTEFSGPNDPAKLFWVRSKGVPPKELYAKTVTAIRAWCEDRTIKEIRAAKTDFFDWGEDGQPIIN
jgi:hypothetical protein